MHSTCSRRKFRRVGLTGTARLLTSVANFGAPSTRTPTRLTVQEASVCGRFWEDLVRIQNAVRIQHGLQFAHHVGQLGPPELHAMLPPIDDKYGVTADYVLGLTVVLADGQILGLGGRTRKRSSGYRLAHLFVGSEGTLGIVTEAVLKLIPLPQHRATALVSFRTATDAASAVARLMSSGHLPAAIELMDRSALELVGHLLPPGLEVDGNCVLLIEQDGASAEQVKEALEVIVLVVDGVDNRLAQSSSEREKLWNARRSFAKVLMAMPKNFFAEDVSVPIAAIPEMLSRIQSLALETGLRIPVVGHAGDGNLHPTFVFEDDQRHLVGPAAARLFADAVELGGSISGEHGLGSLKRDHSAREHSALELVPAPRATTGIPRWLQIRITPETSAVVLGRTAQISSPSMNVAS